MIDETDRSIALAKTTLEQWAVLAAVVDQGGFAQAAEALHRSQSAVSYAVARLQQAPDLALLAIAGHRRPQGGAHPSPHDETLLSSMEASLATVQAGLAYAWLPEHLVEQPLRRGTLRPLPLAAGATRRVSLYLVLVRPELAGPAARAAVECFQRHAPITARSEVQ